MDALCEFIEFWLGPRLDEYGETTDALASLSLPMPLRSLYAFAGRWPGLDKEQASEWVVGAFSRQDSLRPVHHLKMVGEDRVVFIDENQECWACSTLVSGDDPPVWCNGDLWDDGGKPLRRESKVCDSLSNFLVTFVLQELAIGSRYCLSDDGLTKQFESAKADAIAVWERGPYVHGSDASFFLWKGVLVANLWESYLFSANHEPAIRFLSEHQGSVNSVCLIAGLPWRLEISQDGAAKLSYSQWPVEEEAEVRAATFNFDSLLTQLSGLITAEGHPDRNPMVLLHRHGQFYSGGKHLQNSELVTELFMQALGNLTQPNNDLNQLYRDRWPY